MDAGVTPAAAATLLAGVVAAAWWLLRSRKRVAEWGTGPSSGEWKALFEKRREDAFLEVVEHYGTTFKMAGGVVATCDPALTMRALRSKEHSVGRSFWYRMIANALPSGDGIVFMEHEQWRLRHRELTPLLTGKNVRRYSLAMFEAAVTVAAMHSGERNARRLPPAPSSGRLPPLGATTEPGGDLLTAVRWGATRLLVEFALGVDPDSEGAITVGRLLDTYARTAFEVAPASETWVQVASAYLKLRRLAGRIQTACAALLESGQAEAYDATNAARAGEPPFSSASAAGEPASGNPGVPAPRSLLWHLLHPSSPAAAAAFTPPVIAADLNHLNGAHKAIALVTSMALFELSMPAHAHTRAALLAELVAVCGRPPSGLTLQQLVAQARAGFARHQQGVEDATAPGARPGDAAIAWRPPERGDLESGALPLLSRVWRETLRTHVVSMGVLRRVGPGGLEMPPPPAAPASAPSHASVSAPMPSVLPEGTNLLIMLHALHHNPATWGEDAHVWRPDRWRGVGLAAGAAASGDGGAAAADAAGPTAPASVSAGPAPGPYAPFLDGIRRCAGMHLAELEFAVYVYAWLVVMDARVSPPPAAKQATAEQEAGSGGSGMLPGVDPECQVSDPLRHRICVVPYTGSGSSSGGADAEGAARGAGASGEGTEGLWRAVKRPDMFTALDGHMPFTLTWR